ncbi:hypothetical protein M5D96_002915 [Drosophila gunungcola]|uniref:Uncharacterized protein n=1 Tax=Drosophila gunungcola TaxID=103775 RepID=A0A9Q0BW28_9MUSC|nr:hypothetical protein M5D96_002915 [Drosophila gunungcola]
MPHHTVPYHLDLVDSTPWSLSVFVGGAQVTSRKQMMKPSNCSRSHLTICLKTKTPPIRNKPPASAPSSADFVCTATRQQATGGTRPQPGNAVGQAARFVSFRFVSMLMLVMPKITSERRQWQWQRQRQPGPDSMVMAMATMGRRFGRFVWPKSAVEEQQQQQQQVGGRVLIALLLSMDMDLTTNRLLEATAQRCMRSGTHLERDLDLQLPLGQRANINTPQTEGADN